MVPTWPVQDLPGPTAWTCTTKSRDAEGQKHYRLSKDESGGQLDGSVQSSVNMDQEPRNVIIRTSWVVGGGARERQDEVNTKVPGRRGEVVSKKGVREEEREREKQERKEDKERE